MRITIESIMPRPVVLPRVVLHQAERLEPSTTDTQVNPQLAQATVLGAKVTQYRHTSLEQARRGSIPSGRRPSECSGCSNTQDTNRTRVIGQASASLSSDRGIEKLRALLSQQPQPGGDRLLPISVASLRPGFPEQYPTAGRTGSGQANVLPMMVPIPLPSAVPVG